MKTSFLKSFKKFIEQEELFSVDSQLLLAVSGGMDSVVLAHLISGLKNEYPEYKNLGICIAHCNFGLRGKESDQDEAFVKKLGKQLNVKVFTRSFETLQYAGQKGISTQMAARELRYNWFNTLLNEEQLDYLLVAHHKDDNTETILLNLIRGSGIQGLQGMQPKKGKTVRPLLFTQREAISSFAIDNGIVYREDSSNASVKYKRNKLRHQVIPVLKELNPDIDSTLSDTATYLKDANEIFQIAIAQIKSEITTINNESFRIKMPLLLAQSSPRTILFHLLKEYSFTSEVVNEIFQSLKGTPGKIFHSSSHTALKDRSELIISKKKEKTESQTIEITNFPFSAEVAGLKFEIIAVNDWVPKFSSTTACIDLDKIQLPLILRRWTKGDFFYPLGLGKRKLLSDLFTDKKLSITEKENTWILENSKEIVWVAGIRMDERFKITNSTKKILFISPL